MVAVSRRRRKVAVVAVAVDVAVVEVLLLGVRPESAHHRDADPVGRGRFLHDRVRVGRGDFHGLVVGRDDGDLERNSVDVSGIRFSDAVHPSLLNARQVIDGRKLPLRLRSPATDREGEHERQTSSERIHVRMISQGRCGVTANHQVAMRHPNSALATHEHGSRRSHTTNCRVIAALASTSTGPHDALILDQLRNGARLGRSSQRPPQATLEDIPTTPRTRPKAAAFDDDGSGKSAAPRDADVVFARHLRRKPPRSVEYLGPR
jgi:hypothetical protein